MSNSVIGTRIGGYMVEAELGRGGMGVVYRAQELALGRAVALKLLHPSMVDDPVARTRFQREITNTAAIEHPHVVPVYSAGYEDGHFYIAMRFVQGRDLGELLHQEGRLEPNRAFRLVGQIASALHAVHATGLVHRDIKPQNVLLWNPGESDEHSFLTDFGIAKALDEVQPLTRIGALGTPGYMAPEVRDGRPATPACDQYGLAVLAFELLTGRLPFDLQDEIQDIPRPLHAYSRNVPRHARETLERALSPDPAERHPDVRALALSDPSAHLAFEQGRAITSTVTNARDQRQLVLQLETKHGLSVEAIAEIADLKKTEVVRLRRKAAREALIGE
jgi:serine/threonine-protein kinase